MVKQVRVFSENYGDEIEDSINKWLSNPAHRIYDYELSFFGASHYLVAVITYWERGQQ